jgi:hypothetical protein
MRSLSRREFMKSGMLTTGAILAAGASSSSLLGCSNDQRSLRNITIEAVDTDFEREPLSGPLVLPEGL